MGRSGDCNCGRNEDGQEKMIVTLILEDDTKAEYATPTIFTAGEKDYIALLLIEGKEVDEGEVYLHHYSESEDGQPSLEDIEDDDEYGIVADALDELLDSQGYDKPMGEDEIE